MSSDGAATLTAGSTYDEKILTKCEKHVSVVVDSERLCKILSSIQAITCSNAVRLIVPDKGPLFITPADTAGCGDFSTGGIVFAPMLEVQE